MYRTANRVLLVLLLPLVSHCDAHGVGDEKAAAARGSSGSETGSARAALAAEGAEAGLQIASASLLRNMGGVTGFGSLAMGRNDDSSSGALGLGSGFPGGLNFFGQIYTTLHINNNGNMTFRGPVSGFTPQPFPISGQPMIAPYWGDVDTRSSAVPDPDMNNVYYGYTPSGQFVATWYYVGYYSFGSNRLNAFQVVLTDRSDVAPGDFDVEFRYQQLQWTTGNASGGSGGLGGTPAQVGFDAGDRRNYYSHPDSRTAAILNLASTSNVGEPGVWRFQIREGVVIPAPPTVTNYPLAPAVTFVTTNNVTLQGTRDQNTSVWRDASELVPLGSGPWTATLTLAEGAHDLVLYAKGTAGQESSRITVRLFVDTVAPVIGAIAPADGSFINTVPRALVVTYTEAGSGLDLGASLLSIVKNNLPVAGSWIIVGSELRFVPHIEFTEGTYQAAVQLKDRAGLVSASVPSQFTIDQTPPLAPILDAVPPLVNTRTLAVSGAKEVDAGIRLAGLAIVAPSPVATWSHVVTLAEGRNVLAFTAFDRAGNESLRTTIAVTADTTPPGPVPLVAEGRGNGTSAHLAWTAYDETANGGDIQEYALYAAATPFTSVAGATPAATVAAGTKTYTFTGLTRGQTLHVAVVARDRAGNALTGVSSVEVTATDTQPPEDVSHLRVQSFESRLVASWTHSENSAADLAGYTVYLDGASAGIPVPATVASYEIANLAAATAVAIKVTARDASGNESGGRTVTGVTWLANPAQVTATPLNAMVELSWAAVGPAAYVEHYALYASPTAFTTVEGLTPRVTVPRDRTTARVAGLSNGTTYYFAVTTINLSGGERKAVSPVVATPQLDQTGPEITELAFAGSPLASGRTIGQSGRITLRAQDPIGVSRVSFALGGQIFATDTGSGPQYGADLDIGTIADGAHVLGITAYDTRDNATTATVNITVALAPPPAPTISAPQSGLITNAAAVTVTGTAAAQTEVILYRNGVQAAGPVAASSTGAFTASVPLDDGENRLRAAAQNRGGLGPQSAIVLVTRDASIPNAPTGLAAQSRTQGRIKLTWNASIDSRVVGYDLYRSPAPFAAIAEASKVNSSLLRTTAFDDVPTVDATYYYRAVSVNELGTASEPSNQASGVADSVLPRALRIEYVPSGARDPASGRTGPGRVEVTVTVNEALFGAPFLSIAPEGGAPIAVTLASISDTVYRGSFEITPLTPTGTAYAVFSARDLVGNRGNDVDQGATLAIDTDGPAITELTLAPQSPVKNDQALPVTLSAVVKLDETVAPGTTPALAYRLSGPQRADQPITDLVPVDPVTYRARFTLPANAGLAAAETLRFVYEGRDDLGNASTEIRAGNQFQVYQGDLPPLGVPAHLRGKAVPGGRIELAWDAVADAAGYQVFRRAPGEMSLTALARTADATAAYVDAPAQDGDHVYAVASIRAANGQEGLSGQSDPVTVRADRVAPAPPENLTLELVGAGIRALWSAPPGAAEPLTYTLYRGSGTVLGDVSTLTVVQAGITANAQGILGFIDTRPNQAEPAYVVTAVDAAGNQSAPSDTQYLNIALLPVATLTVTRTGGDYPVIRWTHSSTTLAGYHLYLGADTTHRLNSSLLTQTTYVDTGYTGGARSYTVTAVDANSIESVGRTVTLPDLQATLTAGSIQRGILNRLTYTVSNGGAAAVSNVRLNVKVGAYDHTTLPFAVPAGGSETVDVIVGGFRDLPDIAPLTTTIDVTAPTGEKVEITRSQTTPIRDGSLVLAVQTQEFTRGATGKARFTLENTSAVESEIITATAHGNAPSTQVRFKLQDADGNVLASRAIQQTVGTSLVSLANGMTVARIPAQATFTSEWLDIPVPASAPDLVTVVLEVDQIHYHLGRPDHVAIGGMRARSSVTLSETAYAGTVDTITPAHSFGDEPIAIAGRALDRATQQPRAAVPLKLVISVQGYERVVDLYTDAAGRYQHTFTPLPGEGGLYTVSAVHPSILDRPAQGEFTIRRIAVSPTTFDLRIPRNYAQTIRFRVTAGPATTATNVRLVYSAPDQPGGAFLPGVDVVLGNPVSLGANQSADLTVTVTANNMAADTGQLRFKVLSQESGTRVLAELRVNAVFSQARPALFFQPNFVETGAVQGGTANETVVLENRGLADMTDVTLSLVGENNAAAPSWIFLATPAALGTLAVGERRSVQLVIAPTATVPVGTYRLRLVVESSNAPATPINVFAYVVQEGIGNIQFHVADIYTGTRPDPSGPPIVGLAGARIRVQLEDVLSSQFERTVTTDSEGIAVLEGLNAGRYRFRASAANHQDLLGRFTIRPGVTLNQEIFLDYNLVTVEWSVTEITIQDRYEIVLQATFETDVPAAVVVMQPTGTNLPEMRAGDVFYGELTLTNHGLIRADHLRLTMPPQDPHFRFELLSTPPAALAAKQVVTLPYRIVALAPLAPDGTGSGGATCFVYQSCADARYDYQCTNGAITNGSTGSCWFRSVGQCSGGTPRPPIVTGGGSGGISFGGRGGGGSGYASAPDSIPGAECVPDCPDCCQVDGKGSGQ